MESLNKFKMLTIVVLCLFMFVVAAIYTNTKDASTNKMKTTQDIAKENASRERRNAAAQRDMQSYDISELERKVDRLDKRIYELSDRVNNGSDDGNGLKCRVYGVRTSDGIERLSSDEAIREAKDNDRELVITCSL